MSISIMTEVWKRTDLDSSEKMVMLALADHANEEGMCYPSIGRLSEKTSMSDRGVQKVIRRLEEKGFLVTKPNAGRRGSNHFSLLLPSTEGPAGPEPDSPSNRVHPGPGSPHPRAWFTPTPELSSPEPSMKHQETYGCGKKRSTARMSNPAFATPKASAGPVLDQTREVATKYADKIRQGEYIPLNSLGLKLLELIRKEGITDQQLKERGLQ